MRTQACKSERCHIVSAADNACLLVAQPARNRLNQLKSSTFERQIRIFVASVPPSFSVASFFPDSDLIIPQLTVGFVYAVHISSEILSQSITNVQKSRASLQISP